MNGSRPQRRLGRSIAAVLIGIVAAIVVTLATDFVLHAIKIYPPWDQRVPDGLLMLATAYRTVYGVAAGYLTAYLAPNPPVQHALVGGAFGFLAPPAGRPSTPPPPPAHL